MISFNWLQLNMIFDEFIIVLELNIIISNLNSWFNWLKWLVLII